MLNKIVVLASLQSTVRADDLPLASPPTLLGVVLPELPSLGIGCRTSRVKNYKNEKRKYNADQQCICMARQDYI